MSSIKDSLAQSISSNAGEFALNLIDKLKKNRTDNPSIITNIANNLERKISTNSNRPMSLSKLLDESDRKEILVYDDNDLDDSNICVERRLEKSQSEVNITIPKPLVTSISLNTPISKALETPEIEQPAEQIPIIESPLLIVQDPTPPDPIWYQKKEFKISAIVLTISLLVLVLKKVSFTILIYSSGILTGLVLSALVFYTLIKLNLLRLFEGLETSETSINDKVQSLLVQTAVRKDNKNFDGVYKGWMNELSEPYAPENYFINKTRSVFINLDGNLLRLQTTISKIPKRAVADEKIGQVTFCELRLYDLTECQVKLLPDNLCRKRYWSKKYPICLKNVKMLNKKVNDSSQDITENSLVLFARTDREKEEWYNLFKKSSNKTLLSSRHYRNSLPKRQVSSNNLKTDKIIYKVCEDTSEDLSVQTQTEESFLYDSSLTFMNTFLIRIFADFFYNKHWINQVQTKIQNKLNKIKVPYFMEDLQITGVDLGSVVPLIKQTSEPWYDDKGLWVHLDIDYNGSIQMSLATKLNLMKLKTDDSEVVQKTKRERKYSPAIENSSEEDSPESSGDEYVHNGIDEENKIIETANTGKKFMNIVNKIAASNYFQKAAEMKYIKKAMENVSNCQLLLNVEVKRITGTVALNIPPHPSDRVWYGFVSKPKMDLTATPQVGEKEVSYSAISDLIADKLKLEFQKVLVFPNMDDFYIPILNSEVEK